MMMLYLFVWLVKDKHQPRRATLFLPNTYNGGEQTPTTACYFILSNTCNGEENKYQNNGDAKDESRGGFCVYKNGVHQTCYGAKCGG
jgi:hypothetical protein